VADVGLGGNCHGWGRPRLARSGVVGDECVVLGWSCVWGLSYWTACPVRSHVGLASALALGLGHHGVLGTRFIAEQPARRAGGCYVGESGSGRGCMCRAVGVVRS